AGGADEPARAATPTPARPATPPATSPKPAPKATPATPAAAQVKNCDPIFQGSTSYGVTSSGKGGSTPASCSEAHSVLLTALNSRSAQVDDWRCVAQPNSSTLASCTSGNRTVTARG